MIEKSETVQIMQPQLFVIRVDNDIFFLTYHTISKYQNSLLFKVLVTDQFHDRIVKKKNIVYIDADPDVFRIIISYLRGYPIDFDNISQDLKKKINYDAKYFQLNDLVEIFEGESNSKNDNALTEESIDEKNSINNSENNEEEFKTLFNIDNEIEEKKENKKEDKTEEEQYKSFIYKTNNTNNEINTECLLSRDKTEIEKLINKIQDKLTLTNEAFNVINTISTDKNICNILKNYNSQYQEDYKSKQGNYLLNNIIKTNNISRKKYQE